MFALGIAAALTSPLILNIGFIIWQDHWKGSAFSLNLYKCNLASLGFLVLSCTTRPRSRATNEVDDDNVLFPSSVFTKQAVGYLVLSSFIGIVIGDWAWLRGLQLLGARRTILMDSIKPFVASLLGFWILDETLRLAALGGIILTVMGVLLVSLETTKEEEEADAENDLANKRTTKVMTTALDNGETIEGDTIGNGRDSDPDQSPGGSSEEMSRELNPDVFTHMVVHAEPQDSELDDASRTKEASSDIGSIEPRAQTIRTAKEMRIGYVLSLLNAGLDTYGAVLTKQYGVDMTVWEISLIRFGFAGLVMLILSGAFCLRNWATHQANRAQRCDGDIDIFKIPTIETSEACAPWYALPVQQMHRNDWVHVTGGVLLVTFAAPSLFNYALFQIALALTLTLSSVGPLYSLPLEYLMQKDVPSMRAGAGALLAVAGIVVLAFKGSVPSV